MKKAIVLGGGGFRRSSWKRLKDKGYHVRIADIKNHEYRITKKYVMNYKM